MVVLDLIDSRDRIDALDSAEEERLPDPLCDIALKLWGRNKLQEERGAEA